MKILVLGSNSFTGSHFINFALEHSDADIIGVSRSSEYNPLLLAYLYGKKSRPKRYHFFQMDLNQDLERIVSLIDEHKPRYIVNYAAQGEVRNSWRWPEQWYITNCLSVVRLTSSIVERDFIERYVTASTPETYGTTGSLIPEQHSYEPSTPYAASKLAGDLHLMTLFKRYSFPVCYTRAANVYGIHQQLYRIIPRTIIYLLLGKKIELHGGGKSIRTFVHVRDAADATWKICTAGKNGEVYHIAPSIPGITIAELVKLICSMMGYDFNKCTELCSENYGQDALFSLSSEKIERELGWRSSIALKDGIQEMINWITSNWEQIKTLPHEYIHKQ